MENDETFTLEDEPRGKSSSGLHIVYITVIVLLLAGSGYLYWVHDQTIKDLQGCTENVMDLDAEKIRLNLKLDSLQVMYDTMVVESEEMRIQIELEKKKISELRWLVNKYKGDSKELVKAKASIATLQETAKSYLDQIDSLQVLSKQLIDQNQLLTTEVEEIKKIDAEKTQQLEELTDKVEKASQLKAFNVVALPLSKKSKPSFKAKKVTKIKTSATIGENLLVDAEKKTVYVRVIRGDGACLSASTDNMMLLEGEEVLYSDKREISYNNKETNVDIYYDANDDITSGSYKIVLVCDGIEIGETSFVLK